MDWEAFHFFNSFFSFIYHIVIKHAKNRLGSWASGQKDDTYAHEVGHMLGLADQYVDVENAAGNLDGSFHIGILTGTQHGY